MCSAKSQSNFKETLLYNLRRWPKARHWFWTQRLISQCLDQFHPGRMQMREFELSQTQANCIETIILNRKLPARIWHFKVNFSISEIVHKSAWQFTQIQSWKKVNEMMSTPFLLIMSASTINPSSYRLQLYFFYHIFIVPVCQQHSHTLESGFGAEVIIINEGVNLLNNEWNTFLHEIFVLGFFRRFPNI